MKYPFIKFRFLLLILPILSYAETENYSQTFLNHRSAVAQARYWAEQQQKAIDAFRCQTSKDTRFRPPNEHTFSQRLSQMTELMSTYNCHTATLKKTNTQSGTIAGKVQVAGTYDHERVHVLAFDELGYCRGMSQVDTGTGEYCVENLPSGSYYVLTKSKYIDEFYKDIQCSNYENWRFAERVKVHDNEPTANINFDLDRGAVITGHVTDNQTLKPINNRFATFYLFSKADKMLVDSCIVFLNKSGQYSITLDYIASYFIQCRVHGYERQFFDGHISINAATPLEIQSLNQTIEQIDFDLTPSRCPPGAISGVVRESQSNQPLELIEIIAVNRDDPTKQFSTFSMFESDSPGAPSAGSYQIEGIPPGTYTICAIDHFSGFAREFFQDAEFEHEAIPVNVTSGVETRNVNFTLSKAGNITGVVYTENGAPLDSIFVLCIPNDDAESPAHLMDRFINGTLYYGQTDIEGKFEIKGLPNGQYIIQSYSYLTYPGKYLDRHYNRIITITDGCSLNTVDLTLDRAGSIAGQIMDIRQNPIDATIHTYVFDAQNGNYEFFTSLELGNGRYRVSGLSTGEYKVFFDIATEIAPYVSQFYDGHEKFSLKGAEKISVVKGQETTQINTTISMGGIINGFIYLPGGQITGADTLSKTLLILYDTTDSDYVMDQSTTFCGGYEVRGIPSGSYKLCAFPTTRDACISYYGGGKTFDDANSKIINVKSNDMLQANITVNQGMAEIAGKVVNDIDFSPLNFVYILAYDKTGHAVSYGVSGVNLENGDYIGDGRYAIQPLMPGNYYIRSWFIFALHPHFTSALDAHYNQECYDEWYEEIRVEPYVVPNSFSFFKTYFVPPLFSKIHPTATKVQITIPDQKIHNIDFALDPIEHVDSVNKNEPPSNFYLYQNYPNPFNPSTEIHYNIDHNTHIKLSIYNIRGKKILDLVDDYQTAGHHSITWSGQNRFGTKISSGLYFCVLKDQFQKKIIKMTLVD